jgi:hypothetical protein
MIQALEAAGFRNARVCEFFDSFAGTNKEHIARKFDVRGANFTAYR